MLYNNPLQHSYCALSLSVPCASLSLSLSVPCASQPVPLCASAAKKAESLCASASLPVPLQHYTLI